VMVGNNTPTAPLTLTSQTATLPTPSGGTLIHLIGSNSTTSSIFWSSYAANGSFNFERADGGLGTEAALANNDVIGSMNWRGYNGSAYSGNAATFDVEAVGAWTTSNNGTAFQFRTTAQGAVVEAVALGIYAGVVIGSGTSDPGAGNLSVGGDIYTGDTNFMHRCSATLANGASSSTGTLTNAPSAGNPTKWIAIDDNGTTRHIPAW
jgi:hypothetical protein